MSLRRCSVSDAPTQPAQVVAYALARPAREVLFTVVSRDEKYRAKLVLDTAVQRFGDALAAGLFHSLQVGSFFDSGFARHYVLSRDRYSLLNERKLNSIWSIMDMTCSCRSQLLARWHVDSLHVLACKQDE